MLAIHVLLLMSMSSPAAELTTVARGTLSGIERPRRVVVQDHASWRVLWTEHAPEQELPRVDFAARTVMAVFLGSRMTAGYGVEVTRVERRDRETIVYVRESRPGPDQMLAQVITTPFHIVSVPRVLGTVSFVDEQK